MAAYEIQQGKTFALTLRWEDPTLVYKAITAIGATNPCRITCTGHGIVDGWRVAVTGVKGMTGLNVSTFPLSDASKEWRQATVIDANTVELNDVDVTRQKTYTSGGYLAYNTPIDMSGYTCRMKVKDKVGGTVLLSTEVADDPLDLITATIDNVAKTITITIPASATEDLTWKKGVFDVEMHSAGGVVTEVLAGTITVVKEVTTS